MSAVLLDTSALLAHALGEPMAGAVDEVLAAGNVLVASPTPAEFMLRLRSSGVPADRATAAWSSYRELIEHVVPIDEDLALRAADLRLAATARVPLVDLFIAAAADSRGALLVHIDRHLEALPPGRPARRFLTYR